MALESQGEFVLVMFVHGKVTGVVFDFQNPPDVGKSALTDFLVTP
jgi:hypothetical protein